MRIASALAIAALAAACTPETIDTGTPDGGSNTPDGGSNTPVRDGPAILGGLNCDPIVGDQEGDAPKQCGFPFPSDVYLKADATTDTGKRVEFGPKTLPKYFRFAHMDRAPFATRDGWSQGGFILTYLKGASITGLPTHENFAISLEEDSPTVIIEAETGTKVAHFAELDMTASNPDDRSFLLQTAARMKDGTRYIVAIRNVKDAAGTALEPTDAFRALRDGTASTDPSVEPRRALYTDIFAKLDAAGVEKATLQQAWDFTTASKRNTTEWLVHMRDDAFRLVGEDGPEFTINSVTPNPNEHIERRIEGTFKAPLYLTQPGITVDGEEHIAGRLRFGADGMPEASGTMDVPFIVQIPKSVAADPGQPILQQGHGLLGSRNEGRNGYFARLANEKKYVTIAIDLLGMQEEDEEAILDWITGDMAKFQGSVDRQHQGHVNQLLAMRMMTSEAFRNHEHLKFNGTSAIDPTKRYYRGDSQGGIMGTVYMALSTDVERGYLGEPGMPYALLLNRSVDFDDFLVVLQPTYSTARNLQLVLALLQHTWDRTEPSGWASYVTSNMVKDSPAKRVLIGAALGDYQVTPLGAHKLARTIGAKHLIPGLRTIYGLTESTGPLTEGSAIQEFSFDLPEVPRTNTPPRAPTFPESDDPHDKVRELKAVFDATDLFLRSGEVRNFCQEQCDPE